MIEAPYSQKCFPYCTKKKKQQKPRIRSNKHTYTILYLLLYIVKKKKNSHCFSTFQKNRGFGEVKSGTWRLRSKASWSGAAERCSVGKALVFSVSSFGFPRKGGRGIQGSSLNGSFLRIICGTNQLFQFKRRFGIVLGNVSYFVCLSLDIFLDALDGFGMVSESFWFWFMARARGHRKRRWKKFSPPPTSTEVLLV